MELTSTIFTDVLSPLAAFVTLPEDGCDDTPNQSQDSRSRGPTPSPPARGSDDPRWAASFLNPQSRIDSLAPRPRATWRVDGVDVDGSRFFAVPAFRIGKPPLKVDVYLPPVEEYERGLRDLLKPEGLMYVRGGGVGRLGVTQHVLRALDEWGRRREGFEREYEGLPFGSRIVVTSVVRSVEEMSEGIHLCPDYEIEGAMLSVDELQEMWRLEESAWPPLLDWEELRFERQLHESITLVSISRRDETVVVFKSLTRDQRYMYNELKMLLTLPSHPNIISRPLHVVTKRGRFGGKRGICGFLIEYFPLGSLKQRIYDASIGAAPRIAREEQFRWSKQIISALIHINEHPAGFYPDLKPDNVVLRINTANPEQLDVVLLDLEQRGGWYSWSPPEIAYLEYLEALFKGLEDEHGELRDWIQVKLKANVPGWVSGCQEDRYHNSHGGFSAPWLALLQRKHKVGAWDLEKAQVFMLGKLLWCIFEETPFVRCGVDYELLQDNVGDGEKRLRFSEFRRTPEELRGLVQRCTQGASEFEENRGGTNVLELRCGRLVARDGRGVIEVANEYWSREIERARAFLDGLEAHGVPKIGGGLRESIGRRPTLREAEQTLERVEKKL